MNASVVVVSLLAGGLLFSIAAGAEGDLRNLPQASSKGIAFGADIKPVLERSCLPCHGPTRPKSRFRVDSRETIIKGGESAQAAILPGNSEKSPLVQYVSGLVHEMEMPPLESRDKYPALTQREIVLIRAWIDQGAEWPEGITLSVRTSGAVGEEEAPNAHFGNKSQLFFDQIRRGDRAGIAASLKDESLLRVRDESGNTPLIQAAFYVDAEQLALFLQKGGDVDATNAAGATALMKAVWDLEKTRLLLRHSASVNVASKLGNTPLIIAARAHGSAGVVKELLARGASVHAANKAGVNAVMAAAEAGDAEVLRILLDHKADPNSMGRIVESNLAISALMVASQLGHLDCVKLLVERGADVNLVSEHGNALNSAVFTGRREVARLLLDRGANVDVPGRRLQSFRNDTGLTALMYAALNERDDPTLVEWLLERGADVNATASSGETALSLARLRGQTKITTTLIAAGANPIATESEPAKRSPLWTSEQIEQLDASMIRKAAEKGGSLLLESGARLTEATGNRCSTCHQQSQPALACALAREKELSYPKEIAGAQLDAGTRAAKRRMETAIEEPPPVPSIAAWFLIGLHAAGYPADTLTDNFAYTLARYQSSDGRWITKAARAPMDYSDVTSTALAIRALRFYAPPTMKARCDQMIDKAARWLLGYEAYSTEERALQLLGLSWAGYNSSKLNRFRQALLREQRGDGGWAQLPTLDTDAYATGLSLYTLNQAGGLPVSDPTYQRGVKFLLSNQLNDGSWFVRTRASPVQVAIDDIFPHGKDQWISSAATTWSTMTLMLALPGDLAKSPK